MVSCKHPHKWILAGKLGIHKKKITDHTKFKKEDQNVNVSVLLRRENKILMGENTGKKSETETRERVI